MQMRCFQGVGHGKKIQPLEKICKVSIPTKHPEKNDETCHMSMFLLFVCEGCGVEATFY